MKKHFHALFLTLLLPWMALTQASTPEVAFGGVDFTTTNLTAFTGGFLLGATNGGEFIVVLPVSSVDIIMGGNFNTVFPLGNDGTNDVIACLFQATNVVKFAKVNNLPAAGTDANNIFRLAWNTGTQEFTFTKLSNGYNGGSGNGVNAQVSSLVMPNGSTKIFMAGQFVTAGGYGNGAHFAAYDFSGTSGWSQLQYYPMYLTGPSYTEVILGDVGDGTVFLENDAGDVTAYVDYLSTHYPYSGHEDAIWSPTNKTFTQP